MSKKTYKIFDLVVKVNQYIERAPTREARVALATLLDSILFETGNYAGFGYKIHPDEPGHDPTQVTYYIHKSINW